MSYASYYDEFGTQNAEARAASARKSYGPAITFDGTGSFIEVDRAREWSEIGLLSALMSYVKLSVAPIPSSRTTASIVDARAANDHLMNIKETLKLPVSTLASTFGVTRQSVYKWMSQESYPEPEKLTRITNLSLVADRLRNAQVSSATSMVKMKAFDGRSIIELVAADSFDLENVGRLIEESNKIEESYRQSGISRSKANPTDDWRSEHSISGALD